MPLHQNNVTEKCPRFSLRTKSLLALKKSSLFMMQQQFVKCGNTATFVQVDLFGRVSVVFDVGKCGPDGSLLIPTIYNTSAPTHKHIHAQTGKQRAAQARIQTSRL